MSDFGPGKSWKSPGIWFSDFCGNPVIVQVTGSIAFCSKQMILFENKADIMYREKWHPKYINFLPSQWRDGSLAHLCELSHDDMTTVEHETLQQFVKKKAKFLKILPLTGGYLQLKFYALLVMLVSHLLPVVVFRLGKNCGEFSKWRLTCTPVSFYNSEKGPRPSDHGHRSLCIDIL